MSKTTFGFLLTTLVAAGLVLTGAAESCTPPPGGGGGASGGSSSIGSIDPNEISGPLGFGEKRIVQRGDRLDYVIYFENKEEATAAAYLVRVTLPQDPNLDWTTLRLGEVVVSSHTDLGLVGKASGSSMLPMSGTPGWSMKTDVVQSGGNLEWTMRLWDPATIDHYPDDPTAGILPPNDPATHIGEGHVSFSVSVKSDAADGAVARAAATIVFDTNDPITTDPSWWNTVGSATAEGAVGEYVSYDLVEDLGIEIPEDVDYAKGDKVTVKIEGLAKGLKVVATPVYEDPNAKKKVIVGYKYTIEGVPTETVDFETQAMYARVSVTYKDKTKTADGTGKAETLQPVGLSIVPQDVSVLTAGVLTEVYEPVDIAELWPEVADAKANPKDWTFKGWPAGIKYNATAKDASWSYKDGKSTVKTNAEPWTVYGQPTKAGEYPITATWKHKLDDNKTTVSETFSAVLTVWGDDGATDFRYTDQAYVETKTKTLDETFKSFSGLPTGIKWTAKPVTVKNQDKSVTTNVVAFSLYGTPTKAGVYAVTATKVDPNDPSGKKTVKETFLWKVAPAAAPTFELDTGTAPVEDMKAQIVQGANLAFPIETSDIAAKVTASGLPTGMKLVATPVKEGTKTIGNTYSVEGIASKPGEYRVTFKTVLNGVTTTSVVAFTVKGNPFVATYCGYMTARPAVGAERRLGIVEVAVTAAGTVKLTYTEGKTKYTASVKSFDWDDATGKGTAEGLVLKVSSADKKAGYGDRKATVTFEDCGVYLKAKLDISDVNGTLLSLNPAILGATVKTTEVPLPASQTFVFQYEDGGIVDAIATVSVAYDAKKATAAFSGKLFDGTAVKATVPVIRVYDEGSAWDYSFAPFLVVAKDGTAYCFNCFYCWDGGYVDWMAENGMDLESAWADYAEYTLGDKKFAELVPEAGVFTFGWGSDAETVGADEEKFTFVQTLDKNKKPAGVAIYDAEPQEGEKPLATVTAKMGKTTGAISVSFTSKKGDKAKYAVELVWRGDKLFAGHVTRTWKDGKVSYTAYGTAIVSPGDYLVIDLSGGPNAVSYPVSYLAAEPQGGWTDEYKTDKLVLRKIRPGTFTMGSPADEEGRSSYENQHTVTLTKSFYMGVFEVTQRQWELVMGTRPSYFSDEASYQTRPVEQVSYVQIRGLSRVANWPESSEVDSISFIGKIREKTGLEDFDLPTEAQWEYACRAGTTAALNNGKDLTDKSSDANMDEVGRYWRNGGSSYSSSCAPTSGTAAVGSYKPNDWGLYDMHGNVWEWCLDWWASSLSDATDPVGPASDSCRVMRGGSWHHGAGLCRSASRNNPFPSFTFSYLGFRLCCSEALCNSGQSL